MNTQLHRFPILSCEQAQKLESQALPTEADEWSAMKRAGSGIARAVLRDYEELRAVPQSLRVLGLIGKGNNGGDALIACGELLAEYPRASVTLLLSHEVESMRPLARKALTQLEGRVRMHLLSGGTDTAAVHAILDRESETRGYDICLDGLLGMSFKPPVREPALSLIHAVNAYSGIALRAAVDLPSGIGEDSGESEETFFQADFTYATGVVKRAAFDGNARCGRVRFIDLGFFDGDAAVSDSADEAVITERILAPFRSLRKASVDKRTFGHLFIVGGSAFMPGALLMSVQAAVRSGVGLVTVFAPASLTPTLSAQVPEAMWVPWPENPNGTLNPKALPILFDRLPQATAVLVGPGMGRDRMTELLVQDIVRRVEQPIVLDADALRLRAVELTSKRKDNAGEVIITPHMGEYMRVAKLNEPDDSVETLRAFCRNNHLTTILKGPHTRICDGERVLYNICGGPVLSRGGTGDLLAGLIAGLVAQDPSDAGDAAARGVVLHGAAAERLARKHGQVAVRTTQLLDFLSAVLREPEPV